MPPENGGPPHVYGYHNGYEQRNGHHTEKEGQPYGANTPDPYQKNEDATMQNDDDYQQYGTPAPASPVRYIHQQQYPEDGHQRRPAGGRVEADMEENDIRQQNYDQTLWYV